MAAACQSFLPGKSIDATMAQCAQAMHAYKHACYASMGVAGLMTGWRSKQNTLDEPNHADAKKVLTSRGFSS
jgi:hypothetical protein